MKRHFKRRFSALLFLCALLTGCEKPQQRTTVEADPVAANAPADPAIDGAVPAPVTESTAAAQPAAPPAPAAPLPMEEPVFKIWMADGKITITGALKSRLQADRIVTTMKEAFPEEEIVNELKVEGHRYPVGWGNRLADELLVPYFKEVKSPGVAYRSGVVTLLGEVEDASRHRVLTEIAIDTFAGEFTQDIANQITTGK